MDFWNDPLKTAADWLLGIFTGWGMPDVVRAGVNRFSGCFGIAIVS